MKDSKELGRCLRCREEIVLESREQDQSNADAWTDMSCARHGVTKMREVKEDDVVIDALAEKLNRETQSNICKQLGK